MSYLKLLGKHFYDLGLNVTCISNRLTEHNFYHSDILKVPYHKWKQFESTRQSFEEFDNYNWDEATGIGTVLGFDNLHVLDIDGCSNDDFIDDILLILGLPKNYEWVVRSGSHDGYHIYFYSDIFGDLIENQVCTTFSSNQQNNGLFEKMELLWNTHAVLPNSIHKSGEKYIFINTNYPKSKPERIEIVKFNVINNLFLNRYIEKKDDYDLGPREKIKLIEHSDLDIVDLSKIDKDLIFIFDTETDGLIENSNFPNIIQISWIIMDYNGTIYKKSTELINRNFNENSGSLKVNNLKPEIIKKIGSEPEEVFQKIVYDLKNCHIVISHNIDFDYSIIKNEFNQYNINFNFDKLKKFCTMKWGHNYLKRRKRIDNPKYPKMTELFELLFYHSIKQNHNSNSDVVILSKIVRKILFLEKTDSRERRLKILSCTTNKRNKDENILGY